MMKLNYLSWVVSALLISGSVIADDSVSSESGDANQASESVNKMTFDDAVNNLDGFTIEQPTQDQLEKEWIVHNKPAENSQIPFGAMEIIAENVNSYSYNLQGELGMFVVHGELSSGNYETSYIFVNSTSGSFYSTSSIASNSAIGVRVDNGVLSSSGRYARQKIIRIERFSGSDNFAGM
ncbi:hypothetical protein ACTTZI_004183 [Vibrio vulnificus]